MRSQRVEEEGEGEGTGESDDGDDTDAEAESHLDVDLRGGSSGTLQTGQSVRSRAGSDAGAAAGARGWAEIPTYDEATGAGAGAAPRVSDATIPVGFASQHDNANDDDRVPRPRASIFGPLFSRITGQRAGASSVSATATSNDVLMSPYHAAPATESGPPMASRSAGQSLTSLLLHPTQTRDSTASTATSRHPAPATGRTSRSSSGSFLPPASLFHAYDPAGLPNESALSLAALQPPISAPVPGSLLRTGTIAPKKGFTAEQIKFLSSTENINVIGMPVDELERVGTRESVGPGRRRRSTNAGLSIRTGSVGETNRPPPTWTDVVEDDRRRSSSSMMRAGPALVPNTAPLPLNSSPADSSTLETDPDPAMVDVPINTPASASDANARPWTAPLRAVPPGLDIEIVPPTPISRS